MDVEWISNGYRTECRMKRLDRIFLLTAPHNISVLHTWVRNSFIHS